MADESGLRIDLFDDERPRLLVVSHERSGTHFLMNTLAGAFGYVSNPWIDFDHHAANINYFHPPSVEGFFTKLAEHRLANPVKSHHQIGFFEGCLANVVGRFTILYVYRNPIDGMRRCDRFMNRWDWFEGPRTENCKAYIRAEPSGHMMRYQINQHAKMLKRWQAHVEGWLAASEAHRSIVPVRFEDLDRDYEKTVDGLAEILGLEVGSHVRPSRQENVVAPSGASDAAAQELDNDDLAFFEDQIGATMARLGYLIPT